MYRVNLFAESIESQKEIEKLSEFCIERLAKVTYNRINRDARGDIDLLWDYVESKGGLGFTITQENIIGAFRSKFLQPFFDYLEEFIEQFSIKVIWGTDLPRKNTWGMYSSEKKRISLYIHDEKVIQEILDTYTRLNDSKRIISKIQGIYERRILSTLVHELTHAYDDFVSSGEYMPKDYVDPQSGGDWGEYAKQNMEVNARYSQATYKLDEMEIRYTSTFEAVVDEFKRRFEGWGNIGKDQQKRLIKRLYEWYMQPIDGRQKKRALRLLHNILSHKVMHDFEFTKEISNNNLEIPESMEQLRGEVDVVAYLKDTAELLLSGKYSKKDFDNPIIRENRYKAFSIVKHLFDRVEMLKADEKDSVARKYENMIAGIADELRLLPYDMTMTLIASRFE